MIWEIAAAAPSDIVLARQGPYSLTAADFLSLRGTEWLTDQVIVFIYLTCSTKELIVFISINITLDATLSSFLIKYFLLIMWSLFLKVIDGYLHMVTNIARETVLHLPIQTMTAILEGKKAPLLCKVNNSIYYGY